MGAWDIELQLVTKIFFLFVISIFMHAINEFKANEIESQSSFIPLGLGI
jgi:hypothetical protein